MGLLQATCYRVTMIQVACKELLFLILDSKVYNSVEKFNQTRFKSINLSFLIVILDSNRHSVAVDTTFIIVSRILSAFRYFQQRKDTKK